MPEPILISIAAALEAAVDKAPDSPEVRALGEHLAREEQADPPFATDLRTAWGTARARTGGAVVNQVTGTVSGNLVQARDIHGDISF